MNRAGEAAEIQRQALGPDASVWVSASAGTGKTKVLTDRLLALMLAGTDPARILCLTFTRAAAAEMANRVNARLAAWATMLPGALAEELGALIGRMPDQDETTLARQLFARVLDSPGTAKIATIHAFCQSLLRRFPLEAGVPPEFAVLEERGAAEALAEAAETVIAKARDERAPLLAEALAVVARYIQEDRFTGLLAAMTAERGKLRAALAEGETALRRRLAATFAVPEDVTPDALIEAFCAAGACDEAGLHAAAAALAVGSSKDQERGEIVARWCDMPERRGDMLDEYAGAFLTDKGTIIKNLITKGANDRASGDMRGVLNAEAERVLRFTQQRAGAMLIDATIALIRLGNAVLRAYEERKRLHGLLDFDDLVLKTLELLRQPGIAPWVLFKLDGGLDHILIDEAQDTNPDQWAIVAALTDEFFTGEGGAGRERNRTVFAVGDAKQSIYSFQRADPRAFVAMRQHFETRVTAAQQRWRTVPLEISFRATEPLLNAVDAVFRHGTAAADGVALDGVAIRHVAAREGHAGIVELWPPVMPEADEELDLPALAGARQRSVEPRTRLANAIAATIADWLRKGERLEARDRAIRPGDIMVLVRRRNLFVTDLIRALKERNVPVAGADRLVLTEQLAAQDLIALGHFLLLPEDDLNLAAVLKGPLFGFSEDQLFQLAHSRGKGQKLWHRLRELAAGDLVMHAHYERLSQLRARADYVPPFELYAEILGAGGGRRAILERLGPEAGDPVEEFLALALSYEREHVPSLQGFLHWLVAGGIEVKRDFGERQRDEVRILTVHGAKGLEAPIVFLPDTLQLPDWPPRLLWSDGDALPLWCARKALEAPFYTDERGKRRAREMQEYRRLLYVALTRAQDRLYVCGWETRRPLKDGTTWHALCHAGWSEIAEKVPFDARALIGEDEGWCGTALRIAGPQEIAPVRDKAAAAARLPGLLPQWARMPPPAEPDPPKPLLPSRPSGPEPPTFSPLAIAGRDRFKRGLLVHKLLQSLPEVPPERRAEAARRFLALPVHGIPPEEQDEIGRETMAVLNDLDFAELWGADAQAEVPVVGLIPGSSPGTWHALSGQIDRLVVTRERVLIVDYKTLRPPPATEEAVPAVYLRQLATYQAALQRIYPDRPVECALLWTEGPRLMPISPARLAGHLPGNLP
jgi:ATP-dependent helicase/nuclease subunit A